MDMKKLLAGAAILTFASTANAFDEFTIDEGSVPGAFDNVLEGDKLNGGYRELLTINADFSFDTVAFAQFGQIFADDGASLVPSQLGDSQFGGQTNGYEMYAVFSASGAANPINGIFTGISGNFNLYIDPDQDTTFNSWGATGADPMNLNGTADDYLIAFASDPSQMIGQAAPVPAFDFIWEDFTLTAAGEEYFIEPDPFHARVNVDGDFDTFAIAPGNIFLTGDVSAVFVPEPGSLALFAGSLLGLGYVSRRRKAKA